MGNQINYIYEIGDIVMLKGTGIIAKIENLAQWDEYNKAYKIMGVSGWHQVNRLKLVRADEKENLFIEKGKLK